MQLILSYLTDFAPKPLFQSEAKCETIDMKMSFHSHANKTLSNEKGFTLRIVLKVRIFGTIIIFFFTGTLRDGCQSVRPWTYL